MGNKNTSGVQTREAQNAQQREAENPPAVNPRRPRLRPSEAQDYEERNRPLSAADLDALLPDQGYTILPKTGLSLTLLHGRRIHRVQLPAATGGGRDDERPLRILRAALRIDAEIASVCEQINM